MTHAVRIAYIAAAGARFASIQIGRAGFEPARPWSGSWDEREWIRAGIRGTAVKIVSEEGTAFLVSADEYRSLKETV